MGFLQTLFGGGGGKNADPTQSWTPSSTDWPLPEIDIANRRFGSLEFGVSDIHAASFLGRPPGHKHKGVGLFRLAYPDRGFQVEFDGGQFDQVCIAVGPSQQHYIDPPWTGYAQPMLWGLGQEKDSGALLLGPETKRADIIAHLGTTQIVEDEVEEEEAILTYNLYGLHVEFEIEMPADRLYQVNVYNMQD